MVDILASNVLAISVKTRSTAGYSIDQASKQVLSRQLFNHSIVFLHLLYSVNEDTYNMNHAQLRAVPTYALLLIFAMPSTVIFHRILLHQNPEPLQLYFIFNLFSTTLCLEDAPSSLGHNVENIVQEQNSWQDHKKITPAHGKVYVCGRCCEQRDMDIAQS